MSEFERLSEYEEKVLRAADGQETDLPQWGAAIGVAASYLKGRGFLTPPPVYKLTEKGQQYLDHFGLR